MSANPRQGSSLNPIVTSAQPSIGISQEGQPFHPSHCRGWLNIWFRLAFEEEEKEIARQVQFSRTVYLAHSLAVHCLD